MAVVINEVGNKWDFFTVIAWINGGRQNKRKQFEDCHNIDASLKP